MLFCLIYPALLYVFLETIIERHNDRPLKILFVKTPMYSAFSSIDLLYYYYYRCR